jgi:hypothetical protein
MSVESIMHPFTAELNIQILPEALRRVEAAMLSVGIHYLRHTATQEGVNLKSIYFEIFAPNVAVSEARRRIEEALKVLHAERQVHTVISGENRNSASALQMEF